MKATKESAAKALEHVKGIAVKGLENVRHIAFLTAFVEACQKCLPSEAKEEESDEPEGGWGIFGGG